MTVVHHVGMERDWARLGKAFAAAREAAALTQTEVAERIGVTRTPIQAIERGTAFKKVTGTMRSYARVVGWTAGSIEQVLAGGDPAYEEASASAPQREALSSLPLAILDQLKGDGPLIDATVISLPSAKADVHMTIVVRGEPNATPEEIRDALLAWRRTQRRLQNLDDEGGEAPRSVNEA